MPRTQECSANCSVAHGYTARQLYLTMRFTVAPQHGSFEAKRQVHATWSGHLSDVTNTTFGPACGLVYSWVSLSVQLEAHAPIRWSTLGRPARPPGRSTQTWLAGQCPRHATGPADAVGRAAPRTGGQKARV